MGPTSSGTTTSPHHGERSHWGRAEISAPLFCPASLLAMAVCQPDAILPGVSFLRGSCSYSVMLDACPPFPQQGQPSPPPRCCCGSTPHAPSVLGTRRLLLPAGTSQHLWSWFNLPFSLLFTIFQSCPFSFSPRCCLQCLSPSRMVSGLVCRTFLLRVSSCLSSVGLEKSLVAPRQAAW